MSGVDKAFALIVAAAIRGKRCPQNAPHGPLQAGATSILAKAGKIRIEVFRHNWRVVTILEGENKGKQTAPAPAGEQPYRVTDKTGTRINGKLQDYGGPKRQGPSRPRDYSYEPAKSVNSANGTFVDRILELLKTAEQMTLQDMSNRTGKPIVSCSNAVHNLIDKELVERVDVATYRFIRTGPKELPKLPVRESSIRPLTREELMRRRA